MKTIWFILRDHRDELWRRWAASLDERIALDYRELLASALGERIVRTFVEDLVSIAEAEEYEAPHMLRDVEQRVANETEYRHTIGFSSLDMVIAWQALRAAIIDVLIDALVRGEAPSFTDSLMQLKRCDALIDRMVCATMTAE